MRHVEQAMGTVFSFDVRAADTARRSTDALGEATAWLHRVDDVFSTYRPDSAVSRLRRGEVTAARAAAGGGGRPAAVRGGRSAHRRLVHLAAGRSARPHRAGQRVGRGAGGGPALDAGATGSCVNGGGDVQLRGEAAPGEPWRVGVADPRRSGELLTVVTGHDLAIATSGITERGAHITDPRDGSRPTHLLSATVTGPHLTWADAYATAAVVLGPAAGEWVAGVDGYELLSVPADGAPWCSAAFSVAC